MCCSPAAAGTICAMLGTTVLGSLREVPRCCPPGSLREVEETQCGEFFSRGNSNCARALPSPPALTNHHTLVHAQSRSAAAVAFDSRVRAYTLRASQTLSRALVRAAAMTVTRK